MTLDIICAEPTDTATVARRGRMSVAQTPGHLFHGQRENPRISLEQSFDAGKIRCSLGKPDIVYWVAHPYRLPVGCAEREYPLAPPGRPCRNAAELPKIDALRASPGVGRVMARPLP